LIAFCVVYQGFCLPPEYSEDAAGEGATEFKDIESGGLGEGEGVKDVSDQIESEDQVSVKVIPNRHVPPPPFQT
jgi:midasin (ATPase involved in ribosome maturation)